tara:strand:- start:5804 stop:6169 length:366 start_codon:yes stop_codon:yes gene_type:complete
MFNVSRSDFELFVQDTISNLPDNIKDNLNNVDIVVDEFPTNNQLLGMNLSDRSDLLGLYEGIPVTLRSTYDMVLPDKITVFQHSIESICDTVEELTSEIEKTILHEIAHHFGITDEELEHL